MPLWGYILIGVVDFIIIVLAITLILTYIISTLIFRSQLVRTSPDKFKRECSCITNEEHVRMYNTGLEWGEENKEYKTEVSITNDGLKLVGEYFDFGFSKCVLIEQGRAEGLFYNYYFAKPYKDAGCNVLVIDTRANGLSEGRYISGGWLESRDIPVWINHITQNFPHNKEFYIHGICVGSAAAIFAAAKEDFPECVKGIVAEGPFHSFYESFREHLIDYRKPVYPILWQIRFLCKIHIGTDIKKQAPITYIDKINVPILMFCGRKDVYSLPEKCQSLFDKCSSNHKRLVWFDEGSHSHLRINAQEKYDSEIIKFISETGET